MSRFDGVLGLISFLTNCRDEIARLIGWKGFSLGRCFAHNVHVWPPLSQHKQNSGSRSYYSFFSLSVSARRRKREALAPFPSTPRPPPTSSLILQSAASLEQHVLSFVHLSFPVTCPRSKLGPSRRTPFAEYKQRNLDAGAVSLLKNGSLTSTTPA